MFTANKKYVVQGSEANAIMSQHVAQGSSSEAASAVMSQHVAQQSVCPELDKAILYRYL